MERSRLTEGLELLNVAVAPYKSICNASADMRNTIINTVSAEVLRAAHTETPTLDMDMQHALNGLRAALGLNPDTLEK